MSKTLPCIILKTLVLAMVCAHASAQEFRWPREKAFELGAGASASGIHVRVGYIRFFQPKKITDIPFKKRFKSR